MIADMQDQHRGENSFKKKKNPKVKEASNNGSRSEWRSEKETGEEDS